jgi:hypothetical protein
MQGSIRFQSRVSARHWLPLVAELDGLKYKGTCYVPIIPRGRRPNSSTMGKR